MCIRHLAGARHVSPAVVRKLTSGCVGAPFERAPFRFTTAVVGLVDRCLSRIRTLAASKNHLAEFFSGRCWPKICPGIIVSLVFESFAFLLKICAHCERYLNRMAGIFEIVTVFATSRFHFHRSKFDSILRHNAANILGITLANNRWLSRRLGAPFCTELQYSVHILCITQVCGLYVRYWFVPNKVSTHVIIYVPSMHSACSIKPSDQQRREDALFTVYIQYLPTN